VFLAWPLQEGGILAAVGDGLSIRKTAVQFRVTPAKLQRLISQAGAA
jgi:hypothetical protein